MRGPSNNTVCGGISGKGGRAQERGWTESVLGDLELRILPSAPGTPSYIEQSIQGAGLGSVLASTGGQVEVDLAKEQRAGTGGCGGGT